MMMKLPLQNCKLKRTMKQKCNIPPGLALKQTILILTENGNRRKIETDFFVMKLLSVKNKLINQNVENAAINANNT